MSISLSYDTQLSRVRATGTLTGFLDTFTRSTSNGWGTATSGQSWSVTGTASDYSTNGSIARQSCGSVSVERLAVLDINKKDVYVYVEFQSPAAPLGGSQIVELECRRTDTSNFMSARIELQTSGAIFAVLRKVVAGVSTTLASATTSLSFAASTWYSLRFRAVDSDFAVKIWRTLDDEPVAWTLVATDASITAATDLAVRSVLATGNTNTLPVVFDFDNLVVNGDAVVERSTDQIRWSQVRGGTDLGLPGATWTVDDYEFSADVSNYYRLRATDSIATASTTPSLAGQVWLKFLNRPFLNTIIEPYGDLEVRRRDRNGVFDIVGRSLPIAVTDVRGSREFDLELITRNQADHDRLDLVLAGGDPAFLHTPPGHALPSMYAAIGEVRDRRPVPETHFWTLPIIETAMPDLAIVGGTNTYQTVLNTYATYTALLAANATYQDIADGVADPADVIVP